MTTQPHDSPENGITEAMQEVAQSTTKTTTDRAKRFASAAIGGTLVAFGLNRRSLGGAATALAGGWLLYRGLRRSAGTGREFRKSEKPVATEVNRSITIGKPADELYQFWRDPEQLSQIMGQFAEVTSADENRLRWSVSGPTGRSLSWETNIVEERPGEFFRWASVEGASVPNEGSIHFRPAPGDRGTEVTLRLQFDPPDALSDSPVTKLLGIVPDTLAGTALRRFKSLVETGEIPTLERNPSGRGSGDLV